MPPLDQLRRWFIRDIRHVDWQEVDIPVDQLHAAEIRFTTKFHIYTITADESHGESFLGCTCFDRQRRTTGFLPEGYFDEDTWTDIAEAIEDKEMFFFAARSPDDCFEPGLKRGTRYRRLMYPFP